MSKRYLFSAADVSDVLYRGKTDAMLWATLAELTSKKIKPFISYHNKGKTAAFVAQNLTVITVMALNFSTACDKTIG